MNRSILMNHRGQLHFLFPDVRVARSPDIIFHPLAPMNYEKYPWLRNLDSPGAKDFLSRANAILVQNGVFTFPHFLSAKALQEARLETITKAAHAFESNDKHNVYLLPGADPSLSPSHVRNREYPTRVASIAYDELDEGGTLAALYNTDTLAEIVRRVTGLPGCYHSADPLGRCSVNVFKNGWKHAWHFDESEYSTTLMLQKPESGGVFQYTKPIRNGQHELVADTVEEILDDSIPAPKRLVQRNDLEFEEGTLSIFCGRRSLHRVTDCAGFKDRLVAVFAFSREPGYCNSESVQRLFWGRAGGEPRVNISKL
jgi:hypothetical protein